MWQNIVLHQMSNFRTTGKVTKQFFHPDWKKISYCRLVKQYFIKMLHHHTTTHILPLSPAVTAKLLFSVFFFFSYTHILRLLFRYTGTPICLSKWLLLTFWCSASNLQQLVKCIREGQFICQETVSKVRNARSLSSLKEMSGRVLRSDKGPNIKGLVHFCIFPWWKYTFSSL